MRQCASQWSPEEVEGELMPFSFTTRDGEEILSAPCVYVLNLPGCVGNF